ncbi:uncharacterized protein LOC115482504 [Microcaecilia unicolor]|uniref:Uncharacterized protein LOC115482504 n=1 Tax=Microcaecilia unicolor TaxID=1415580 RepID=A0A6P7ZFT6_9AMPH|nr:uncharacterized protein LOC115482504 [Microcaecilia unicolor]
MPRVIVSSHSPWNIWEQDSTSKRERSNPHQRLERLCLQFQALVVQPACDPDFTFKLLYVFLPWHLIGHVVCFVVILVALDWSQHPWHMDLMTLLVVEPVRFLRGPRSLLTYGLTQTDSEGLFCCCVSILLKAWRSLTSLSYIRVWKVYEALCQWIEPMAQLLDSYWTWPQFWHSYKKILREVSPSVPFKGPGCGLSRLSGVSERFFPGSACRRMFIEGRQAATSTPTTSGSTVGPDIGTTRLDGSFI